MPKLLNNSLALSLAPSFSLVTLHLEFLRRLKIVKSPINSAYELIDLRAPPGNRLEALKGDWAGFHSIRVNEQWRIIFRWEENNAHDVRLIDHH